MRSRRTRLHAPLALPATGKPPVFNRVAYAAAHVVADPLADADPWLGAAIDWDTTLAYRRHLWSLGLGVAEAMDTAQRGMGLDWPTSLQLIARTIDAAKDFPGALLASGAGTDHLRPDPRLGIDRVIAAYEEQMRGDRSRRKPHHSDGEPGPGGVRQRAGRLRAGV